MAARAIWKGVIKFDELELPVKLYSAVEDRSIHFHLLHDQDNVRLKQRMLNPETGDTVLHQQMQKAYETEPGLLVMLSDAELESLQPEESRDVHIAGFVADAQINHQWYDRPYWLGPDGDDEQYFALAQALDDSGLEGVARWTMRKKEYMGSLRAEQGYLCLITLRSAEQIIASSELDAPMGRPLDKQERDLAGRLIGALQAEFDPSEYRDEYRRQLKELIETKRKGGTIEVQEYEQARPPQSLAESLQASLKNAK